MAGSASPRGLRHPMVGELSASAHGAMAVRINITVGNRANDTATQVYAYTIEHGPISACDIARALGLDPSQVYETMETGLRKGFDITILDGKPRRYAMRTLIPIPKNIPTDLSIASLMRFYASLSVCPQHGQTGRRSLAR